MESPENIIISFLPQNDFLIRKKEIGLLKVSAQLTFLNKFLSTITAYV